MNSILETAEDKISELEDRFTGNIHNKRQNRMINTERNAKHMWETIKRYNRYNRTHKK